MEETKRKIHARDIIRLVAVIMSLYHLYTCIFGIPESQMHRALHLLFALILTFGLYNWRGKKNDGKIGPVDWVLMGMSVFSLGYMVVDFRALQQRILYVTPLTTLQIVVLVFILIVIVGNGIGGMLIPFCRKFMYDPEPEPAKPE